MHTSLAPILDLIGFIFVEKLLQLQLLILLLHLEFLLPNVR